MGYSHIQPCEEENQGKVFCRTGEAEIKGPQGSMVEGMKVQPAGEVVEGTGHHHILINQDFFPPGQVIPTDDTHRHFGKGDTEAVLDLPPGDYKLTLQFAMASSASKDFSTPSKLRSLNVPIRCKRNIRSNSWLGIGNRNSQEWHLCICI
jgi:hypothetical protein